MGLDPAEANRRLGLTRGGLGGLAYWVAALRECFEEAGILLARRAADGEAIDVSRNRDGAIRTIPWNIGAY